MWGFPFSPKEAATGEEKFLFGIWEVFNPDKIFHFSVIIFKVLVCTIIKINLFFFTSIRKVVNDHMNVWLFKYVFQVVICKKKNFFFKFKGLKQPRWLVPLRKHHLLSMNITEIRLLKTPIKARWLHWNLPARNLTRAFSFWLLILSPLPGRCFHRYLQTRKPLLREAEQDSKQGPEWSSSLDVLIPWWLRWIQTIGAGSHWGFLVMNYPSL